MPKSKHGKLKNIKIDEVSMVDLPANKLPFLFFKREGTGQRQLTKAKKKININIESDGTGKGTAITINGDKLSEVRDFSFYFYGNDAQSPVSSSYSKVVETEDGFKRTETFYLSKGVFTMTKEMLKALQDYFGTEDINFEKKVDEEVIQKAIELITKEYKEDFPEDLDEAIGVLAKCASGGYQVKKDEDLEKAGAKFSKDVLKKLRAVLASVEALKSILPDIKGSTEKSKNDNVDELTKQLTELKETIAEMAKSSDSEKKDKLTETIDAMKKQIEILENDGATKKSINGQDNDNDDEPKGAGENGEVLWKSFQTK